MNELVFFNNGNFMKAEVVTTSLMVAEVFGKEHKDVLRDVNKVKNNLQDIGADLRTSYVFTESTYKDSYGRNQRCIELNFNAFTFVVMGYTGKEATKFKDMYIKMFNHMYDELVTTRHLRAEGMKQRRELTDAIQKHLKPTNKFVYSNFTNLCYKKIFGATATDLKKCYGVKDLDALRDFLDKDKIEDVAQLEQRVAMWIEDFDMDYNSVKNKLFQEEK